MEFDSNILKEQKNRNNFLIKILEWSGYKKMQLLYIEEQEIVMNQKIFIINVIIKDQQLLYIKMKNAFLEVIILIHGHLIINGFLPQIVLYFL